MKEADQKREREGSSRSAHTHAHKDAQTAAVAARGSLNARPACSCNRIEKGSAQTRGDEARARVVCARFREGDFASAIGLCCAALLLPGKWAFGVHAEGTREVLV